MNETLDPLTAIKGLTILTAIPVVMLALWAEYYGRYIDSAMADKDSGFDAQVEHGRIRMCALGAFIFQVMLYLGSSEVRQAYPIYGNVMFLVSLFLQAGIQGNLERKVKPEVPVAVLKSQMQSASRAFLWCVAGAAMYAGILLVSVSAFAIICKVTHASGGAQEVLLMCGAVIGVLGGLILNFALGPVHLRKILPTQPIVDPELVSLLGSCFQKAGLSAPTFHVVETGHFQFESALIAGFRSGKGLFKPALFVSKSMIEALTPMEVQALVLREVSHLSLEHLRKRFLLSFAMIVCTTFMASFVIFLSYALSQSPAIRGLVGPACAFAAFFSTFRLLGKQNRMHEFEADVHSVQELGSDFEHLAGAWRKLAKADTKEVTEFRIKALRLYFERKAGVVELKPASKDSNSRDRAA